MADSIDGLLASDEFRNSGWARVASIAWDAAQMTVDVAIDAGQGGPTRARWRVTCTGVREYRICDANGGGLKMSGHDHPAVRQYLDLHGRLRLESPPKDANAIVGPLWLGHRRLVDDWIEFDRYMKLPFEASGVIAEGPRFLLVEYAAILRTQSLNATWIPLASKVKSRAADLSMLHFGASYVIAEKFSAARVEQDPNHG